MAWSPMQARCFLPVGTVQVGTVQVGTVQVSALQVSALQVGAGCLRGIALSVIVLACQSSRANVVERSSSTVSAPPPAVSAGNPPVTHPESHAEGRDVSVPQGMLPVPGGAFRMGADDEGELDERPSHLVTIAPFFLDTAEVTNAQYGECVVKDGCLAPASLVGSKLTNGRPRDFKLPDHPVVGVSWDDASYYCKIRGQRLPTEAEWERAARGADGRKYVWGDDAPDASRHGVFGGKMTTEAIKKYPAGRGPYGHFDLAGNVWEWVADEYDPYAYQRPTAGRGQPGSCEQIRQAQDELRAKGKQGFTGTNPIPTSCERVLRGGAYNYRADGIRASNRVHHPGGFRIAVAGFRCALSPGNKADPPGRP